MNFLHLAGHLGADPETRFTASGQKVITLRVAARSRRNATEENTIWWRVTIWGDQFDKMVSFLKKGSAVMVFGEMNKPEIYTDRNGNSQISMSMTASSLTFSPFGRSDKAEGGQYDAGHGSNEEFAGFTAGQQNVGGGDEMPSDDEIPF